MNILAAVSGDAVVSSIIWIIVMGLVFWLLSWLINYIGLPEPFGRVAKIILAVAAVVFLVNELMSIAGHPIIVWR